MATSRREPQPNARTNRSVRNMSPVLKPGEPDQVLRRARSVPSSPDRRSSSSPAAASSSNACRPSSSFNPRTASSSRSTSGSASSSSTHAKTLLHSVSSVAGAKQANIMRRRADKSGATSVWPHALATPSNSSKDPASRAAKSSPSNVQKSKLSTRLGNEKTAAAAASSPKPRTQKAVGAGKTQAASSSSSTRTPGAMAKRRTGSENSAPSIQRTTSVPVARPSVEPKAEEQEVELLMEEFDERESISTPSIEEHLQERLPDPVDFTTYATSEDAPSEPSFSQEEYKNDQEVITKHISEEKHDGLNEGDNADIGFDSEVVVAKEAVGKTELKEAGGEAEPNEAASETGLKESADETELNETAGEIELKGTADETKLNEADSKTELTEAASKTEVDSELIVKEEANASDESIILPATTSGPSNEVTEESRSKITMQERRNRVMALVGRFETAMSGRE